MCDAHLDLISRNDCPLMLVGCKEDLRPSAVVSVAEADTFARNKRMVHVRTSAKTLTGVDEAFDVAASLALEARMSKLPVQTESVFQRVSRWMEMQENRLKPFCHQLLQKPIDQATGPSNKNVHLQLNVLCHQISYRTDHKLMLQLEREYVELNGICVELQLNTNSNISTADVCMVFYNGHAPITSVELYLRSVAHFAVLVCTPKVDIGVFQSRTVIVGIGNIERMLKATAIGGLLRHANSRRGQCIVQ